MANPRRALVIGINRYPAEPLAFCVRDAEDIRDILTMPEYAFDVETVIEEQGTRRHVKESLDRLFSEDADVVLLYFSGHGKATDVGAYLVTVDADAVELGIDLDYLKRVVQARSKKIGSVVFVLDCCHAGAATMRGGALVTASIRGEDIRDAFAGLGSGRVVLAACRADELAGETAELGHGIFTHHVINGLLGGAADQDGVLTVPALYDYVSKAFERVGGQAPVLRGDISGRIVLASGLPKSQATPAGEQVLVRIEAEAEKHLLSPAYHSDS